MKEQQNLYIFLPTLYKHYIYFRHTKKQTKTVPFPEMESK